MALDQSMIEQLSSIFSALEHQYILRVTAPNNEKGKELSELVTDLRHQAISSQQKSMLEIIFFLNSLRMVRLRALASVQFLQGMSLLA